MMKKTRALMMSVFVCALFVVACTPPQGFDPTDIVSAEDASVAVGSAANFGNVDVNDEEAVRALGGAYVTNGDSSIYIGYEQVSSDNQDPRIVKYVGGKKMWYRKDYETSGDDSKGYGLIWDGGTNLFAVFSATGTQGDKGDDFRRFAEEGWLTSYGQGGGAKIAIIARIHPGTGDVEKATFLSALLSSGNVNSLTVTNFSLTQSNVVVYAKSWYSPRNTDKTAISVSGDSPFPYVIEFSYNLNQAVRAYVP